MRPTKPDEQTFPIYQTYSQGLTKREYFAAHAPVRNDLSNHTKAQMAVEWADALIKALNEDNDGEEGD